MPLKSPRACALIFFALILSGLTLRAAAAELPLLRVAYGAFNEKVAVLWVGAEQGLFRKHGVEVEAINVHSGPDTIQALTSGEAQVAYTAPGSVVNAAARRMDMALFAGIVNRADGDFVVAPRIRSGEQLKEKSIGVQGIGGGVWLMTLLAMEQLGIEPIRDKISLLSMGDQSVLAQALTAGRIDAAHMSYVYSAALRDKGFRTLLDLGKASIAYQGLALAARRSYLRENSRLTDSLMRGVAESVAFIQTPSRKEAVVQSLTKNLRLRRAADAERGYAALQWLYSLDMNVTVPGVQTVQRLLTAANPLVKRIKLEDVIDPSPNAHLQKTAFYQDLVTQAKRK